jgi:long-chain acyl-CoA synthetase
MQTYTTPGGAKVAPNVNAVSQLLLRADAAPDHKALAYRDGVGFSYVTTSEMADTVREIAAGLVAWGVEKGDRIALYCGTRVEFTYFDYAIWAAGAATTTIYETSSADQVRWIIADSESVLTIAESLTMADTVSSVMDELPNCRGVLAIDGGAVDALKKMATDESRAEVDRRIASISHDDLATLVYTSGTTGRPKGCVLTHENFAWEVSQLDVALGRFLNSDNRTLMFLPLAHIFARAVQAASVSTGVTLGFSSGIPNLMEELPMFKPTWIFSVPRVFEKVYNGAKARADADGKGSIFDRAAAVAIDYSKGVERGKVGLSTNVQHALFDRLVYGKLRVALGGDCNGAISGGAPLGARLGHFFRGIGVTVYEGYGLTETTAGATVNSPDAIRVGSVGRPLPGASVKIADDGEVMIKGGMVFSHYWNNEVATAEAMTEDDWFHSGDLGAIDEDGFLSITGRKKEIIVTAAGKNVAPAILEDRMRSNPLVSQVMVVGDAKPFIAALVTLDEEALPGWAASNGKGDMSVAELQADVDVLAEVEESIAYANKAVSKAESIRTFRILPTDLTIEGGELTPTLKVKRSVVASKYATVITDIYG